MNNEPEDKNQEKQVFDLTRKVKNPKDVMIFFQEKQGSTLVTGKINGVDITDISRFEKEHTPEQISKMKKVRADTLLKCYDVDYLFHTLYIEQWDDIPLINHEYVLHIVVDNREKENRNEESKR